MMEVHHMMNFHHMMELHHVDSEDEDEDVDDLEKFYFFDCIGRKAIFRRKVDFVHPFYESLKTIFNKTIIL